MDSLLVHLLSTQKKKIVLLIVSALLTMAICSIPVSPVQAQDEEIRVALFIDAGDQGYRQTVPMVSISSETGLELRGTTGIFTHQGQGDLRVALDQYFLIVSETKQATEARQVSQMLAQQGIQNAILRFTQNNTPFYRVVAGSEAQSSTLAKLQQDIAAKTNKTARIGGPWRIQTGSFNSWQEAANRLSELGSKGFTGYIAQVVNGQGATYQVWLGDELNQQGQQQLLQQAQQAFPSYSFQIANPAQEYILEAQQALFGSGETEIPYYLFSAQYPLVIKPKQAGITPLLTVEEKENRSYRGYLEVRSHRQQLAVINVLPLEQYLYSVVGTEMATGWPLEALKTQAVMSRNYAYLHKQQNKYGIAHLTDSTVDQAYFGYAKEAQDIREAVEATAGEYLTYKGNVFYTFYHSNAGGMTAEGKEAWGNPVETHLPVMSNDRYPETVQATWYRIEDRQGRFGYVISLYIDKLNQRSPQGYTYGVVNTPNLNYRSGPSTDHLQIGSLAQGEQVLILEEIKQNNAYSWISGPFTPTELAQAISRVTGQTLQPVRSLVVTERGASGRVLKMEANGQPITVRSPDALRQLFRDGDVSLRSTKFTVEAMGDYSLLGAGGSRLDYPLAQGQGRMVVRSKDKSMTEVNGSQQQFAVLGAQNQLRIVSKEPAFRLQGYGYGHGLGASQWGIRAMASEGYTYQQILNHYFHPQSILERR